MSPSKPQAQPAPEPTRTRSAPDKWARASQLARKLAKLDDDEQQELAQAPSDIRAKYEKRRETAVADAPEEVLEIVSRMRRSEAAP